jgi:hypothetical protein
MAWSPDHAISVVREKIWKSLLTNGAFCDKVIESHGIKFLWFHFPGEATFPSQQFS